MQGTSTFGFLQLWVAYAPCGSQHKDAVQVTLEQIDLIKRFINQYPNHLRFVNDSSGEYFLFFTHPNFEKCPIKEFALGHSVRLFIPH